MKKEMVFRPVSVSQEKYAASRSSLFPMLKDCVSGSAPVLFLARFYARLLDLPVSPLQALHLTHAQLAFFLMLFPVDFPVSARLLLLGWFAMTVLQCRRAGLK